MTTHQLKNDPGASAACAHGSQQIFHNRGDVQKMGDMSEPRYLVLEHPNYPGRWIVSHGTDPELAWSIARARSHWAELDGGLIFSWASKEAAEEYAQELFGEPVRR